MDSETEQLPRKPPTLNGADPFPEAPLAPPALGAGRGWDSRAPREELPLPGRPGTV